MILTERILLLFLIKRTIRIKNKIIYVCRIIIIIFRIILLNAHIHNLWIISWKNSIQLIILISRNIPTNYNTRTNYNKKNTNKTNININYNNKNQKPSSSVHHLRISNNNYPAYNKTNSIKCFYKRS